ncbi:MAG: hypothetical protein ACLRVU_03390 [Beduini sp.]|uniref:hypothetical protein n=1 Tax=Beduini sp. TaxID=1922300 RepID=UPI00399F9652
MNYIITQNGLTLEKNFETFPTQYSENVKVALIRDPVYNGHIIIPFIAYGKNKQYVTTPKMLEDDTLVFPKEVFEESGIIALSLSIAQDDEVKNTNVINIRVNKSSGKSNPLPADEETWKMVLSDFLMQELRDHINPAIKTILEDTRKLQDVAALQQDTIDKLVADNNTRLDNLYNTTSENVQSLIDATTNTTRELIDNVNQKVLNGDFNGLTILNGIGVPNPSLGRNGDSYINTEEVGDYAQYLFIKVNDVWEPQFKIVGKNGTDTLPIGAEVLIDADQPTPPGYEEVDETYEASEVFLENGNTVEGYLSTIDLDGNVQKSMSMATIRDSSKEMVKVQLTDSTGKAVMIETSADQVYIDNDTKLSDVLNGQTFYIKQENGLLYIGNYTEWVEAGKPSIQ